MITCPGSQYEHDLNCSKCQALYDAQKIESLLFILAPFIALLMIALAPPYLLWRGFKELKSCLID